MSSTRTHRFLPRRALLGAHLSLLLTVGCGESTPVEPPVSIESNPAATATPTPPSEPPAPAMSPDEAAAQRSSHIAERCMNQASVSLRRIRQQYLNQAAREAGPVRPNAIAGGIFYLAPGSVPECRTQIDQAVAMQPAVPDFDTAATTYITALEAALPVLTDASNYYTRRTYDDDQGAHARELHTDLLRVLDAFIAADAALSAVVQDAQQRALEARVAELAADPSRRGLYLIERSHACASRTARTITALEVEASGRSFHLTGADGAALMGAITTCQTEIDEMVAAPETAQIDTGGSIRNDANAYLGAALVVGRAVRDDTMFSQPGSAVTPLNRAIEAYNSLIQTLNRRR